MPRFFFAAALVLLFWRNHALAFQVDVDFNTYNHSELAFAATAFRDADSSWTITANSPGISTQEWSSTLSVVGKVAFSEDNPESTEQCSLLQQLVPSKYVASFQYHETGGVPATMLNSSEIDAASVACGGCKIIILTRAFWPNSQWRKGVESVLDHPKLFGVAMEFNPSEYGKRHEGDFVNEVLSHGKSPFFLLPFLAKAPSGEPAEVTIENAVKKFAQMGANMSDSRVHLVLARYGMPRLPISGGSNSIAAAFAKARQMQKVFSEGDINFE